MEVINSMYGNGMYRNAPSMNSRLVRVEKEIVVKGYAQEIKSADRAIIAFDLISTGEDPVRAIANNKKAVDQLNTILKNSGLRDEDIFFSGNEIVEKVEDGRNVYESSVMYQIVEYDLQNVSELLYNLRSMNVRINDIIYTSGEIGKGYNETFKKATANAYTRALAAAEELKVKIDPVPVLLKDITNLEEDVIKLQESLIKDYAALSKGLITNYSIVEARYRIVEEL